MARPPPSQTPVLLPPEVRLTADAFSANAVDARGRLLVEFSSGDFLIASDGRVLACKYGAFAFDQWSVDEILSLSGAVRGTVVSGTFPALERGIGATRPSKTRGA